MAEDLTVKVQALQKQFPSWEEEALRDVLMDCGGDMELARSTIVDWTGMDKFEKTDTIATIKTVVEEDEVKSACCSCFGGFNKQKLRQAAASSAQNAATAPPTVTKPEALAPGEQPAIVERKLLDAILMKRMNWEVSGESAIMTIRAVAKVKILSQRAKERVRQRHASGETPPTTPGGTQLHDVKLKGFNSFGSTSSERDRSDRIREGMHLLDQRLALLKLRQIQMEDDGNCQFRSFSSELFGTQAHHRTVRHVAVKWLKDNEDTCAVFATDDLPWDQYLEAMAKPRYWGDELTLFAVCEAYGVVIHLITTEQDNWHSVYNPSKAKSDRHLFLAYISPIHYNTVQPLR